MKVVGRCGRQVGGPEDVWKQVEDWEGAGSGQEGLEEVGKVMGECGRDGKAWECNATFITGRGYSYYINVM